MKEAVEALVATVGLKDPIVPWTATRDLGLTYEQHCMQGTSGEGDRRGSIV